MSEETCAKVKLSVNFPSISSFKPFELNPQSVILKRELTFPRKLFVKLMFKIPFSKFMKESASASSKYGSDVVENKGNKNLSLSLSITA